MLRLRLHLVVAVAALAVSAGGVLACGSLSNASAFGGGSSGSSSGGGDDSGAEDAGPDVPIFPDAQADTSPPDSAGLPPPGVLFVHASPSLPDLRLCWTTTGAFAGDTSLPFPSGVPMPASNYPGLPVGGAVPLGDASSMVGGDVTLYAIDANTLAQLEQHDPTPHSCAERLQKNGSYSVPPGAIFPLPAIANNTIVPGSTFAIALAGCLANDPTANAARCGAGWNASTGNLHLDLAQLQDVTGAVAPGQLAVQAAQLSPALAALAGDGGALVSFGSQGAMGTFVARLVGEHEVAPAMPTLLDAGADLATYGSTGFALDVGGDAGVHVWMSLAQSLNLFDPTQNPAQYYAQPTTYVVAVVGDPASAPPGGAGDAGYDGTGLHLLVLPLP